MPLKMIVENLLAHSLANVEGAEASASMGVANLLNDDPGAFWRSNGLVDDNMKLDFTLANNVPMTAEAMALVAHNFYNGAAEYRLFLTDDTGAIPATWFQSLAPTFIAASTNASGAVTNVDEGDSADGNYMTPTTGTDWDARFDFGTPASAPATGARRQCFFVLVKASAAPTSMVAVPTVKAELYEAGSLVLDLGTKIITSTTNQQLFWSWDAAELATASGADVQIKLTFAGTAYGGVPYPAGHLESVYWICERGDEALTPVTGGDLGWQLYSDFAGSGISYFPEADGAQHVLWIDFGASRTFNRAYLMLRSDGSPPDLDITEEWPPTPPAYVQIGVASMGEAWSPARQRDFGTLVGTVDESSKEFTDGGAKFGSRRPVRRVLSLPLSALTPAEAHTLLDRLAWRQGILKPVAINLLDSDATEGKHTTLWASLRNPENSIEATTTQNYSRSMQLEFIEEL